MERAPSVPQWYWWKTGTVKTASPAGNVAEVCESFQWWAGKPLIHREGRPQVQVREGNWLQAASYTWTLPPAGGRLDAVCSESGSERTVVSTRCLGRWRWARREGEKPSSSQSWVVGGWWLHPRLKLPHERGSGESSAVRTPPNWQCSQPSQRELQWGTANCNPYTPALECVSGHPRIRRC